MIAIGCDHAGYEMKMVLIDEIIKMGWQVQDAGCDGSPCDYPEIAKAVCGTISGGICERGILICGTGIGMSIAANKFAGIRAALCADAYSAKFTRLHNDANVLCLGARTSSIPIALELMKIFLETDFEGGRHQRRVDMITATEEIQTRT